MRVLFLSSYLPYPLNFGAARRLHGLMAGVARNHSVSLIALVGRRADRGADLRATAEIADSVVVIEDDRASDQLGTRRRAKLRSLLSVHSFERDAFRHPHLQEAIASQIARGHIDVVQVESPYLVGSASLPDVPVVVDEHNIEYEVQARSAAFGNPVRRLYNVLNGWKLRGEEQRAWRNVDGCALPSEREAAIVREAAPSTLTAVVPNAVDTEQFAPQRRDGVAGTILFFGALNYFPNLDGITYFVREVMPRIRAIHPGARLVVAGAGTREYERTLGSCAQFVGTVPDIRPLIESAQVVVAPLRIGGGTRLKILEAMSMARPVVATRIGAEGIEARDGEHVLLADTPEAFAGGVTRLLADADLRMAIGAAGRRLVEERYDWRISTLRLERLYRLVLARRRRAPVVPSALLGDRAS